MPSRREPARNTIRLRSQITTRGSCLLLESRAWGDYPPASGGTMLTTSPGRSRRSGVASRPLTRRGPGRPPRGAAAAPGEGLLAREPVAARGDEPGGAGVLEGRLEAGGAADREPEGVATERRGGGAPPRPGQLPPPPHPPPRPRRPGQRGDRLEVERPLHRHLVVLEWRLLGDVEAVTGRRPGDDRGGKDLGHEGLGLVGQGG